MCELHAVFIPKPDGGLRPILLYASPYRIWTRARLPVVAAWEARPEVDQPFWWGGRGKACARCAWEMAAMKEFSLSSGVASIMVAGDLSKFYEHIGHEKLIDEAVATGYPLRMLKMNIEAYRGYRRCRLGSA
jgi:hypothetical protein